jgi:plastocyanin
MRRLPARLGTYLVLAACLPLLACGDAEPSSPTPNDLAKIDLTPDHTITVDEGGFDPARLTVKAGDVVLLVNKGTGPHSFTARERFDTGRLHPGDETTMVLTEPGRIPYVDVEAPNHKASVTVVGKDR